MNQILVFCLLLSATSARVSKVIGPSQERVRYDGYQILKITPEQTEDVEMLRNMMFTYPELDFVKEPSRPGRECQVMVPPGKMSLLQQALGKSQMTSTVHINNVQDQIDEEFERLSALKNRAYDKNDFNTNDQIMAELRRMASSECPTDFTCEIFSIGTTQNDLDLTVFRIFKEGETRQGFWVDSAIHAREWLAPASNMYILDFMLTNYGSDTKATAMLNDYDWYFMPVVNPDGYTYSFTTDRLWRKNLTPFGECWGVDLNRNFDETWWGTEGVSTSPCFDNYCGPSAGSELETKAVQDTLVSLGPSLAGFVTMHAFGNYFMHPWGYTYEGFTCVRAEDHQDMFDVAEATSRAIMATGGQTWYYGTSCEVIYATTGGSTDYAKEKAGVKYSYVPEVRGDFFLVDPSEIELSATELFNGINAMVNAIAAKNNA